MTPNQRISLMATWWPAAARVLGIDPNDRAKRLEVLSKALIDAGRRPTGYLMGTASELETESDVDAVKSYLAAISKPADFNGQMDIANMPRSRFLESIRSSGFHPNYIAALPRLDRRGKYGPVDLDALSTRDLEHIRNILVARARAQKKKGMSIIPATKEEEKMDMAQTNHGQEVLADLTEDNPF